MAKKNLPNPKPLDFVECQEGLLLATCILGTFYVKRQFIDDGKKEHELWNAELHKGTYGNMVGLTPTKRSKDAIIEYLQKWYIGEIHSAF